jgi:hypothetical protein
LSDIVGDHQAVPLVPSAYIFYASDAQVFIFAQFCLFSKQKEITIIIT